MILKKNILQCSILTLSVLWIVLTVVRHDFSSEINEPNQSFTIKKNGSISTYVAAIHAFLKRKNIQHFQITQKSEGQIQLSIQKTQFSIVSDLYKQIMQHNGIIIQCNITGSDNNDEGVINVNSLVIQYPI
jgi:hypothetical protein